MLDRPASPKLTSVTRRNSIYPYYAGFSEQFVESILKTINASNQDLVLDPWNGSGTTTTVCARNGIPSIGVDLNPAMKPIAAVRSMSSDQFREICKHAMRAIDGMAIPSEATSPFALCGAILATAKKASAPVFHNGLRFGLMIACRSLARHVRSKNPTWHSLKSLQSLKLSPQVIRDEAISAFSALQAWKSGALPLETSVSPKLIVGDWNSLRSPPTSSHVITSPPYLTRIDYVMKTLPEILLLNAENEISIRKLRQAMLGGVLTKAATRNSAPIKSSIARAALLQIREHSSKASDTYYFRFFNQYFLRLDQSITRIVSPSRPPDTITLVTQGSYYKEIFVDLPAVVDELLHSKGYTRTSTFGFVGSNNMVSVNSRSVASGFESPPETAAVYERF